MATTAAAAAAAATAGYGKLSGREDNVFRYVHSNELEIPVSLKVGTLEGSLPRLNYQDLLNDPILKYSGRNLSKFPDLKIEVCIVDYPDEDPWESGTFGGADAVTDHADYDDAEDGDEVWGGCRYPKPGGKPLHSPVFTSYKHFTKRWEWNEWIKLPVKYSDLPRTARLAVTIYDCCGAGGGGADTRRQVAVGGTTVTLFTKHGTLRQGPADLRIWAGVSAAETAANVPLNNNQGGAGMPFSGSEASGNSATLNRLSKLTKKYRTGKIPQVDWLDRLSFAEIEKINKREKSSMRMMFLDVQFTQFQAKGVDYSVVYFEPGADQVLSKPAAANYPDLIKITDYEIGQENLVESKHYWLARSTRTGQTEQELKPNAAIRNRLNEILLYPPTQPLSAEELDMIWRYRFYLSSNKKALAKFVKCINWQVSSQASQAMELIHQWAPMDVADALELLGPTFTDQGLRQYAVNRMREAPDSELQLYLLQLVQALKYEDCQKFDRHELYAEYHESEKIGKPPPPPPPTHEGEPATNSDSTKSSISSTHNTAAATSGASVKRKNSGGLAKFLIERASKNDVIANYFYWYLVVECEVTKTAESGGGGNVTGTTGGTLGAANPGVSGGSTKMLKYHKVMHNFLDTLRSGPSEWQVRAQFLTRQDDMVKRVVQMVKAVSRENGRREVKENKLKSLLANKEEGFVRFDPPLKLPVDPGVEVTRVIPNTAKLFKSALQPALLGFVRADTGDEYKIIFKYGDDLRQDQLILQIITLFDRILQQENLDLKLSPYHVLATSSKHGFVQFINGTNVAQILREDKSIQNFFVKHNPCENGPYGISPDVMSNYVKSCAGYCVITYLLGVGDRHLDNLLLTKSGKLFHIDFGYILGRDPKSQFHSPPPMKLSSEMIDGFGGKNSDHWAEFRKECYTAFLSLRRHANLILNLFSLMVDASVPDIAIEPDKSVQKVQDKFRLDLNDEAAVNHIQNIIDTSASALMPAVIELTHKWVHQFKD